MTSPSRLRKAARRRRNNERLRDSDPLHPFIVLQHTEYHWAIQLDVNDWSPETTVQFYPTTNVYVTPNLQSRAGNFTDALWTARALYRISRT